MSFRLPAHYDALKIVAKLREFMFTLVRELERVPEKIIISLGSSLAGHSIQTWSTRFPEGKKIISRKELGSYFQNHFAENKDSERSFLAYPLEVLVDGYNVGFETIGVDNPQSLDFKTLLLHLPNAAGLGLIELKKSLGGMPIEFVPLAATFQESFPRSFKVKDALLIEVGGEETTLVFLKDGLVAHLAIFPLGARHFLRGIAKMSSISLVEAEDRKRQDAQGLLADKKKGELNEFLEKEISFWKKSFMEALDSFYKVGPFPSQVFLFGAGANLPEIVFVLQDGKWIAAFSYASTAEIRILEASSFFEGSSLGGLLQGPDEVGLASLIIYALYHESFW